MTKKHRLSEDDKKLFDSFIKKWRVKLNLQSWRVEKSSKPTTNMAEMNIMPEDRLAVYRVGRNFGATPVTAHSLEQTAVHELLHIVLREYQDAVKSGSDEFIMAAEHSVVTVLEGLLVPEALCSDSATSNLPASQQSLF